ncbi:MAG: HNH endonuclease [Planctomycetota bacterium]
MQPFAIEHIRPRCHGGKTVLSNLALACQGCNNHKYNKLCGQDPVGDYETLLFNPRQNSWVEHFAWNHDFTIILGRTAIGRTTVEELNMNRTGVVNLRRLLFESGEHPPVSEF